MSDWTRGEFTLSTERTDIDACHAMIETTYWAAKRTREVQQKAMENSLNFSLFHGDEFIGFARVISDYATFAWVCDVLVDERYRGQGLGKWMMEVMMEHPELQNLRRWILATKDAHTLYERYGFKNLHFSDRWMELSDPNSYA